jgi:hypothetical protein
MKTTVSESTNDEAISWRISDTRCVDKNDDDNDDVTMQMETHQSEYRCNENITAPQIKIGASNLECWTNMTLEKLYRCRRGNHIDITAASSMGFSTHWMSKMTMVNSHGLQPSLLGFDSNTTSTIAYSTNHCSRLRRPNSDHNRMIHLRHVLDEMLAIANKI